MDKLKIAFKNKVVQITGGIILLLGMCLLCSFAAVKINTSNAKSVKVASDIVGQLSEQYLTPKFDAINARLDNLQAEVQKTNDWTVQKDDKEYKALVKLIEKQYEKYNRDKSDIKSVDLRDIEENWSELPEKYKTATVIKEYDVAMAYYMIIKGKGNL